MGCKGLHCEGCGGGHGGGGGLIALVTVLAITGAVLHAIWHTIVEVADIAALVVVSATGAAALGGGAYAVSRIRARILEQRARRPAAVRAEVIPLGTDAAPETDRPALEPPAGQFRLDMNGVDPGKAAEIRRQAENN